MTMNAMKCGGVIAAALFGAFVGISGPAAASGTHPVSFTGASFGDPAKATRNPGFKGTSFGDPARARALGPGAEDCVSFHEAAVTAANINGSWKVVEGSMWLLDYGSNAAGAQQAAAVIHRYHFDEGCFIKRPSPAMMYWKSAGLVPGGGDAKSGRHPTDFKGTALGDPARALPPGAEDCIGLNPLTASLANVGGTWKVVDGALWLLDFGPDQVSANQALMMIRKYHMSRQCFVARPDTTMVYWLAQ